MTPEELIRHSLVEAARTRGRVPVEYVDGWLKGQPHARQLVDRETGKPATVYDVIASDAYDPERRTITLSLRSVFDMERDYKAGRGAGTRFIDWATSDETTAGEKFLDVGAAGLEGVARVGKTLSTASAAAMRAPSTMIAAAVDSGDARERIASGMYAPENQLGAVLHTLKTGETPEGYEQPVAEFADLNYQLQHGEKLPGWRRALLEVLGDPATVGMVKLPSFPLSRGAAALARRSSVGRALLGTGEAGKLARAEQLFARGGRIIDVEAAPVARAAGDVVEDAADDAAEFGVTVRDADGNLHRVNTATGEIESGGAESVPELPETLSAQLDALRRGERRAVVVTPGAEPPVLPRGFKSVKTDAGAVVYNPKQIGKDEVRRRAKDGTLGELLGHVEPRSAATTEVVAARDARTGVELQASYVSPKNVGAQADEFARQYPGARVETGGPELEAKLLDERVAPPRASQAATPPTAEELEKRAARMELLAHAEAGNPRSAEFVARAKSEAEEMRREAATLRAGDESASSSSPSTFSVTREPVGTRLPSPPSPLLPRVGRAVADVINVPKAIVASFDASAFGRQGLPQLLAHPTYFRSAMRNAVKSGVSQEAFDAFVRTLPDHPDFDKMRESGLFLSSLPGAAEEAFASRLASSIPGVRQSARSYSATLDTIRLSAWDNYAGDLAARGVDNPRAWKEVAELINITTGRGVVPVLDRFKLGRQIVNALNVPFFSPRTWASRFNLISPARLVRNAARADTRRVAYLQARDGFRALSTLGVTVGLLDLVPGVDVGYSPLRPDFGKVRVGRTTVDVTGGAANTVRYLARMASAFEAIGRGEKSKPGHTPLDLTARYVRSQLGPAAGVAVDAATGETFEGDDFTLSGAASDLLLPMTVESLYEGWVDAGGSTATDAAWHAYHGGRGPELQTAFGGAARSLFGAVGLSTQFSDPPRDFEAMREAARVNVPGEAGAELSRLGIDLNFDPPGDERADKNQGQFAPPPRTVAGVVDGSLSFSDPEDERGNLGQTPEHLEAMRREYEKRIAETVAAEISKPGYAMFNDDGARKQYLSNIVQTVKNNVLAGFRRETRGREIGELERLKKLHDELEGRTPPPDWMRSAPPSPSPSPTPVPTPAPAPDDPGELERLLEDVPAATSSPGDEEWEEFPEDSGTLKVPRAAMPQIKSEHRGALIQFLKGRGITRTQETVAADSLKPSQAEYSPAKVERARSFEGPQRSILVSSDDYVLDGHHQWLSKRGKPIPVIRLHAPIQELLIEAARFPSSGVDGASRRAG